MADTAVKVPFQEAAAPGTPASTKVVIYAKSDGLMYSKDDAGVETLMSGGAGGGGMATDPLWDAAGDLAQGTGANTGAKLSAGTAGNFLKSAGAAAANFWAFPPGYEVAYAQITAAATINGTTEGGANTVVATSSATYENVPYLIDVFASRVDNGGGATIIHLLYVDSTLLGRIGVNNIANTITPYAASYRYTPTAAAHTFTWKAYRAVADCAIDAGAGGSGTSLPAFIRVTKV